MSWSQELQQEFGDSDASSDSDDDLIREEDITEYIGSSSNSTEDDEQLVRQEEATGRLCCVV